MNHSSYRNHHHVSPAHINASSTSGSSSSAQGLAESESVDTIVNSIVNQIDNMPLPNEPGTSSSGDSSPRPPAPPNSALQGRQLEIEYVNGNDSPDSAVPETSKKTIELKGSFGFIPQRFLDPLCRPLRSIVSQNRRRYIDDLNALNLDLTYITDRVIAMGYPATFVHEGLFRNTMLSTVIFLNIFHSGHFKVFNLRGEYIYDANNFEHRVSAYEMTDHHPPRLELMQPFCEEVHNYLISHPENVVAVHCKAGKGRTGVMICAYLTFIRLYETARQCMDYYSIVRTHNNKGVTIPSQRRYVYYYEHMLNHGLDYTPYQIEIVGVYIEQPPQNGRFSSMNGLNITISCGDVEVFNSPTLVLDKETMEEENELTERFPNYQGEDSYEQSRGDCLSRRCFGWTMPEDNRVFLEGDVCVRINRSSLSSAFNKTSVKLKKLGHIWFNTMFTCGHYIQTPYVHGDEANPYPEDGTTIARKISEDESDAFDPNEPSTSKGLRRGKKQSLRYEINEPPGLEAHCPQATVSAIHRNSVEAPRISIRKMLEKAHEKNLVSDDYNEKRKAAMGSGEPIPKAPVGRPMASGPNCVMRKPDEHAFSYGAFEVDKVCKANNVPPGFRVIIVTRCVNRTEVKEVDEAETRLQQTRHCQKFYEHKKRQEMQAKLENKIKKNIEAEHKPRSNSKLLDLFRKNKKKMPEAEMRAQVEKTMKSYLFPHRPEPTSPERYFRCPLVCPPSSAVAFAPASPPPPAIDQPGTSTSQQMDDDETNRTITSVSSSCFRPAEDIFERLMAEEDESPGNDESE
ncbi:hypothetical protein L596_005454 [Steinernema carpocapsae]|uniref:Uncharacterized protein n=1 Tax=Steinernema carpocapsae TaxID=34508 RepID=A0A4V6I8M9_STECR|nr:hypothetical protein L596_005454 [Steinernema carpocapsae]